MSARRKRGQSCPDPDFLGPGQAGRERLSSRRRVEQTLAAIVRARALLDVSRVDKLLEDARQALLGDLQDVEEIGDGQPGIAIDEVQDAVVRTAEIRAGKNGVRIGYEVAIRKEQQFD